MPQAPSPAAYHNVHQRQGRRLRAPRLLFSFSLKESPMVKITTFNNRPVRHVRYMPNGTVILRLYERRPDGRARHLRVSLPQWLVGRGVYLLDSRASRRTQARTLTRRCG
jgi:hypothetical protein